MTKPLPLKVGDRVKVTGGHHSQHCYAKGTDCTVTNLYDNGDVIVRAGPYGFSQTMTRDNLRKLPDRKEG